LELSGHLGEIAAVTSCLGAVEVHARLLGLPADEVHTQDLRFQGRIFAGAGRPLVFTVAIPVAIPDAFENPRRLKQPACSTAPRFAHDLRYPVVHLGHSFIHG